MDNVPAGSVATVFEDATTPRRPMWRAARWAVGAAFVVMAVGCSPSVTSTASVSGPAPRPEQASRVIGDPPQAVWTAADALGPTVTLSDSPDGTSTDPIVLTNPTSEGVPLAFRVVEQAGSWLKVQYPDRPNGVTGWVPTSQVQTRPVEYRIEVRLGTHEVVLFRGDQSIDRFPAAIGAPSSPTPVGNFYVDARVILADANGPYGSGQVSVTGFSTVYQSFGGGRGQIAIHGTNQPDLLSTPVSHGCVRISNENLLKLVNLVSTGTPVDVVP